MADDLGEVARLCPECSTAWSGDATDACPECGWISEIVRRRDGREVARAIVAARVSLVDWSEFWTADRSDRDWLVEGLWPRGRALSIWAEAKTGKSELILYLAVRLAMGRDPWTGEEIEPVRVLYLDFEMTEDDLFDRLLDFGLYGEDLPDLLYAFHPVELRALDTPSGAEVLGGLLDQHAPEVVVIDTLGRALAGEENSADTIRAFYANAGQEMRRRGIGYARLDHGGKDRDRGPRGSSAKNDDVDVIWNLTRSEEGVKLQSVSRVSWVPLSLDLIRSVEDGAISYRPRPDASRGYTVAAFDTAKRLDALGIPRDWGRRRILARLRELDEPIGKTTTLSEAISWRKSRIARAGEVEP